MSVTGVTSEPRALFDEVFDRSRTAMLIVDAAQRIVRANRAMAELTGHPVEVLERMGLRELRVPEDRASLDAVWQRARAKGALTGVRLLLLADGGRIPVRWSATMRAGGDEDENLIVYVPTSEPVTREILSPPPGPGRVTQRQREIVTLIALGNDTEEIAAHLHIAGETVRTHVRNAMRATGAHNRAHLVALAFRNGWVVDLG